MWLNSLGLLFYWPFYVSLLLNKTRNELISRILFLRSSEPASSNSTSPPTSSLQPWKEWLFTTVNDQLLITVNDQLLITVNDQLLTTINDQLLITVNEHYWSPSTINYRPPSTINSPPSCRCSIWWRRWRRSRARRQRRQAAALFLLPGVEHWSQKQ